MARKVETKSARGRSGERSPERYTRLFEQVSLTDLPEFGGKNASLGEMISALAANGVRVPPGFATTAAAYRQFLRSNDLKPAIERLLGNYHEGRSTLRETGKAIRRLFLEAPFPPDISSEIAEQYAALANRSGRREPAVAVRSSATAEDLPTASFAGQQETFLNVRGEKELLDACRRCYASLFTDRAISYREAQGFDHLDVALSIGVQLMVRSDLAGAGVAFTIDTESGFPRAVVINAAWGLGETVVKGTVTPDKITIFKPLLDGRHAPVIERSLGAKERKLIYASGGTAGTRLVETSQSERLTLVLTDEEAIKLAEWSIAIESHYGRPMDIEWAKDGETGEMFIVQARPETVQSQCFEATKVYRLKERGSRLRQGPRSARPWPPATSA
jgi:pyruvate, water dikinase